MAKTAKKDFADMTPEEQAAEQKRIAEALAAENRPDPVFEKNAEKEIRGMREILAGQRKFKIQLNQVTPREIAAGAKLLPPAEVGINGYNYVIPRGRLFEVPLAVVKVLYRSGELSAAQMVQMGAMTEEEVEADLQRAEEEAKKLAQMAQAYAVQG